MVRKVEQLHSGRYKVRFRVGERQTSTTFARHRDAADFTRMLDVLGPTGALTWWADRQRAAATPTLDELAADHIRTRTGIEPGTRIKYERIWDTYWHPTLGTIPASHLTRDAVADAINRLDAAGKSAKTIKNAHSLLSAVCGRAVAQRWLTENPAKGHRLPRTNEADRVDMRILSPEEFADVVARIKPEHYRPFVRFLAGTGARFGEAIALQVQDVQLPNVRIRRSVKWSPDRSMKRIGPAKTARGNRTVSVGGALAADLAAACQGRAGTDLVFTAPRGGPILHRTFWSDVWLPAVSHLTPRPRLHDLRHTHASWMLAAGVPVIVLQRRLGHEKAATTMDTYGHLLPDAQVAAAAAAEAALGFVTPPELD